MKNLLLILFLFLSSNLFAQNFAPVGAKWYYTHYQNGIPAYVFTSYTLVESVLDTIIVSENCSKLNVTYNNFQNQSFDTWFMRSDSDKIYYYSPDSSRFLSLCDFSKSAGDSFEIEGYYSVTLQGAPLFAKVDSIGLINLNGHIRRISFTHINDIMYDYPGLNIEGIGNCYWMFPIHEENVFGPLRCYSDSILGLYETGEAFSCDWNTEAPEIIFSNQSIEISPNPSSGIFNLQFQNSSLLKSIDVLNVFGKKIFSSNRISDSQFVLNLSAQPNGIYFLQLKTESGMQNKIIVVNK